MQKMLKGIVVSDKMKGTVVVEVTNRVPHPLYKKLMKRSKRFKAGLNGFAVVVGQEVTVAQTRPAGSGKYFKIVELKKEEKK